MKSVEKKRERNNDYCLIVVKLGKKKDGFKIWYVYLVLKLIYYKLILFIFYMFMS